MTVHPIFADILGGWKREMQSVYDTMQCDCCGEMVERDRIAKVIAYGIETMACDRCRGDDDASLAEVEEARAQDRWAQVLEWDNMVGGTATLEWANPRDWRAGMGWSEEAWDKNRGW